MTTTPELATALRNVAGFLEKLPDWVPMPEMICTEDEDWGSIDVEWMTGGEPGKRCNVTLSIEEKRKIPWAWVLGDGSHGNNVMNMDDPGFMDEFLHVMKSVYPEGKEMES